MASNDPLQKANQEIYSHQLDAERWFKVAGVDYQVLGEKFIWPKFFNDNFQEVTLLDVGCGPLEFPQQVLPQIGKKQIVYNCLDPVPNCLEQATQILSSLGYPSRTTLDTIEDHPLREQAGYHLIWAIHSLYLVASKKLPTVIHKLHRQFNRSGICLVFLGMSSLFIWNFIISIEKP